MTRHLKPGEPGYLRARAEGLTGTKHNGITLGAGSPLLTASGRRRDLGPSEAEIQIAAVEALLGHLGRGQQRQIGLGMTGRYPELLLLNALNPNKGGRKKAAAGIAKAMGLCPDVPDLHLPLARGPFLTLYVEIKRPGHKPTNEQQVMHIDLRAYGHCVMVCESAQEIVDVMVGYLALPANRVSLRPLGAVPGNLVEALMRWREECNFLLTPKRGRRA